MRTNTHVPTNKKPDMYNIYRNFAGVVGGGAVLVSIAAGSFIPLIVAGVGLFCVLCFINGMCSN